MRELILGTHKILNESKKSLKEYKKNPERYSPLYCKCIKLRLIDSDGKCKNCGYQVRF